MNYNDENFDDGLNTAMKASLSNLHQWQSRLLGYMAYYLQACDDQPQIRGCDIFIKLLAKIGLNLDSATRLLPLMYDDYRYKASTNILYRSVIDDLINSFYLWGTVMVNDPQQNALMNELTVLHKEFTLSVIASITSEHQHRTFIDKLNNKQPVARTNVDEYFKNHNPDLVEVNGKWKNNGAIRATTDPDMRQLLKKTDDSRFISEAQKLEFLPARGMPWHDQLKSLFKYLSQYQHFSPRTHDILSDHIEQDITCYQQILGLIMTLLGQLFPVLKLKDSDELQRKLSLLGNAMMKSFADERQ